MDETIQSLTSYLGKLTSTSSPDLHARFANLAKKDNFNAHNAARISLKKSCLRSSCIFFLLISCQTLLQQQEQQQEQQQQEEQLLPDRNVIKFVNFRNEGRQDLLASDGSCICLARHDSAFTCAFNNPFPALCYFPLPSVLPPLTLLVTQTL